MIFTDPLAPGPMRNMLMQSQAYTDELIKVFYRKMRTGLDPNDVLDEAFDEVGCSSSDLTGPDKARLKREIETYVRRRF